jgi:hypothetical protein
MYRGPVQETAPRPSAVTAGANLWQRSPSVLEAVKWVLASPDWVPNTLIAYVFAIIPIVGQMALGGWCAEIAQRLVRGQHKPLPKLDFADFGHFMSRGIPGFLVRLVFGFALSFVIVPVMIGGAFGFIALWRSHEKGFAFVVLAGALLIFFFLALFVNILIFAAEWRVELTEQFREGVKFGSVFRFAGRVLGPMLLGLVIVIFASFAMASTNSPLFILSSSLGMWLVNVVLSSLL